MNTRLPTLTSALSDPSRLRILSALRREGGQDELCACHLIALTSLAPSTISKHMDTLRSAGLVLARRDGKWMHYRLPGRDAPPLIRQSLAWFFRSIDLDDESRTQVQADARRLTAILKALPEAQCCTRPARTKTAPPCCAPGSCSCAPATLAARRSPKASRATSASKGERGGR